MTDGKKFVILIVGLAALFAFALLAIGNAITFAVFGTFSWTEVLTAGACGFISWIIGEYIQTWEDA